MPFSAFLLAFFLLMPFMPSRTVCCWYIFPFDAAWCFIIYAYAAVSFEVAYVAATFAFHAAAPCYYLPALFAMIARHMLLMVTRWWAPLYCCYCCAFTRRQARCRCCCCRFIIMFFAPYGYAITPRWYFSVYTERRALSAAMAFHYAIDFRCHWLIRHTAAAAYASFSMLRFSMRRHAYAGCCRYATPLFAAMPPCWCFIFLSLRWLRFHFLFTLIRRFIFFSATRYNNVALVFSHVIVTPATLLMLPPCCCYADTLLYYFRYWYAAAAAAASDIALIFSFAFTLLFFVSLSLFRRFRRWCFTRERWYIYAPCWCATLYYASAITYAAMPCWLRYAAMLMLFLPILRSRQYLHTHNIRYQY